MLSSQILYVSTILKVVEYFHFQVNLYFYTTAFIWQLLLLNQWLLTFYKYDLFLGHEHVSDIYALFHQRDIYLLNFSDDFTEEKKYKLSNISQEIWKNNTILQCITYYSSPFLSHHLMIPQIYPGSDRQIENHRTKTSNCIENSSNSSTRSSKNSKLLLMQQHSDNITLLQ